jgi:hypothetical protein
MVIGVMPEKFNLLRSVTRLLKIGAASALKAKLQNCAVRTRRRWDEFGELFAELVPLGLWEEHFCG